METDQKNHADNESGKHQDAKSDTAVEQVILRRDGTIAFRGIAASREELFLRQVRSYRGKGSLAQSTAFQKLNLDGFRFHVSLLMPSGVGTPTVLNLLPNGGYSAVWMNEANDRLTPDAIISYDRYGTIQEAYDGKGFSMSEGAISDLRAKTGQGVLRDMVKAVIAMSDYAKAGMSFDLGASYATRMTDGGMAVRSIHANRISNAYGPALHPKEGGGLYFKGGKLVSADEGVATAIQYRERTSPEMLVGEETMTAPASIPVYQHHAKRGREFIDYATLEQAMAEKANDPQKAARVTQDKPSPSPSGPSPS